MDNQRQLWERIQQKAHTRGGPAADSAAATGSAPIRFSGLEFPKEGGGTPISGPEAQTDEIVGEAKRIYQEVLDSGVDEDDDKGNETLFHCIRSHHKDFATSFPIVLRWAVQEREFSEKGFRKFLRKYQVAVGKTGGMWPTRAAFLENQADYLVILYREQNTRVNTTFVREYRRSLIHQLLQEEKDYTESSKKAEEEVKRIDMAADKSRREAMYAFLLREQSKKTGGGGSSSSGAANGERDSH